MVTLFGRDDFWVNSPSRVHFSERYWLGDFYWFAVVRAIQVSTEQNWHPDSCGQRSFGGLSQTKIINKSSRERTKRPRS